MYFKNNEREGNIIHHCVISHPNRQILVHCLSVCLSGWLAVSSTARRRRLRQRWALLGFGGDMGDMAGERGVLVGRYRALTGERQVYEWTQNAASNGGNRRIFVVTRFHSTTVAVFFIGSL